MVKGAWVTLATNDSYSLGALVLAHSLKQVGTQQELAILVTPGVTNSMRASLSDVYNIVRDVNILDSKDKANLKLLQRPELGITFTKLHCWQLTEYEKCVFLDADTLVLQNCDELFEREELSAAPDVGWPDCFNSGVFVYRPSEETYNNLIQFALDKGSFDGGDQGLLNLYFADWARKDISKHLPFIYNVCSTAFYSYLPAFKQFGKDVKIIHFIGNAKPWLQYFDTESKRVRPSRDLGHLEPILQRWWNIFCSLIHPSLSPDMSGLAGAFAKLTLGQQRTPEQEALEDSLRRQNWEQGNIDYLGKDSFDNIWSKICETLARGPQENEGEHSTQIRSDDLVVLVSPLQEASAPSKEDILPTSQDTPLTTDLSNLPIVQEKSTSDPVSSSPPVALSAENAPLEVSSAETPASPKSDPSPEKNLTIAPENISASETSETKITSTPTEQILSVNVLTPEDTSNSVVASEIPSEKVPEVGETPKSERVPVEQTLSEISKPEIDPIPTPTSILQSVSLAAEQTGQEIIPSCPVAEVLVPSPEVLKQDIPTEKVLPASQTVPSRQQAPPIEQLASPPQQVPICPIKDVPPVEETTLKEIPSSSATPVSLTEQVVEQAAPSKIASTEKIPIAEQSSCTLANTAIPTECSKQEEVPSQTLSSSEKKATPPPTERLSVKQAPSKPEQVSSEKISQPLPSTEEKIPSSPTSSAPIKEATSKPEQVPPEKITQPSSPLQEKVPISSTQVAPSQPEGTSTPVTSLQHISAPASTDTATSQPSNGAATSPVVSSEPPPPITAPPRKSGANKKQNKPKK